MGDEGEGDGCGEKGEADGEAPGGALGAGGSRKDEVCRREADGAGSEQDGCDLRQGKPEAVHGTGVIRAPFQTGAMTFQPGGRSGP